VKITQIYRKYQIMANLQEHQLRVAAVASIFKKNWKTDFCPLSNQTREDYKPKRESVSGKIKRFWDL